MLIISYPGKIKLPTNLSKDRESIKYSAFSQFNIEDEQSGVNWYFSYKREMKCLVVFKEHVNGVIQKFKIPTARHCGNKTLGFVKELNKIGIEVEIINGESLPS